MESRSPSAPASAWLTRKPPTEVDEDDRDAELARLRERLSFYESFDSLIQENVSRAGELLRHAASVRENAESSLVEARKEIEQTRLSERLELRAMLSGLLDEVTTTQVQVERLARRVADALDDLEAALPAGGELDRLPTFTPPAVALTAPAFAQPLDPTPEEIGPEDPAVIAAARAAVVAPPVIEAEIAAAEAADPVVHEATGNAADAVDAAETAVAAAPEQAAPHAEPEVPIAADVRTGIAASDEVDLIAADKVSESDIDVQPVTAELSSAEPLLGDEPAETTVHAGEVLETAPPPDTETELAVEAIDVVLEQEPDELETPADTLEEGRAWAASEARFLAGTFTQGATWLNPDALEAQEPTAEPAASVPQIDDAAIMTDLAEANTDAEDEPIAPPTAAEDVMDGGGAEPDTDHAPEAPATALEDVIAEVAAPQAVIANEHITEEVPIVPVASAETVAPTATQVDAEAAAEPDPSAQEPPAASTPSEPTPARTGTGRLPWIPDDIRPFSTEGLGTAYRRPSGTGELRMPEPTARPAAVKPGTGLLTAARGASTVVLVHGVPRATTALSLKRYLESLPHVSSVEPREYAEGILRLHVTGERHVQINELRGWADGSDLQPVHVREDLIEVRLPH